MIRRSAVVDLTCYNQNMNEISVQIAAFVRACFEQDATVELSRPDPKFGDFATNVALQLAKPLGKNPREIAEILAGELRKTDDFTEVNVAGPGFINLRLSDDALLNSLRARPEARRRHR